MYSSNVCVYRAALRLTSVLCRQEELTPLGYHLAALPVDVRLGKMLLYGALFGCVDPITMTAAAISYKSPFVAPLEQRELADAARRAFSVDASDHLTTLNAIAAWRKVRLLDSVPPSSPATDRLRLFFAPRFATNTAAISSASGAANIS